MVDRKKKLHTNGKVTTKMYGALKNCSAPENEPTVGKEKNCRWGKKVQIGHL
jgi:hypothetical protein